MSAMRRHAVNAPVSASGVGRWTSTALNTRLSRRGRSAALPLMTGGGADSSRRNVRACRAVRHGSFIGRAPGSVDHR